MRSNFGTKNSREAQIEQELIARNLPGLFDLLQKLKGLTLNRLYSMRQLYAVGGQSILYLASSPSEEEVIVKLPFLPYHRAAYVSSDDIIQARRHLEREAALLQRFQNTVLPDFYELIYTHNPLLSAARGKNIVDKEVYLIMEFVQGLTLRKAAHRVHQNTPVDYHALEWLAWKVASTFANFSSVIARPKEAYLYSDLNPTNIVLTTNMEKPIRILDAGSLIPFHPKRNISPPFTWAYIPPEYYETYDKGKIRWPTSDYVMYALGKTLWEILTDRRPYPKEDPDLSDPTLGNYSKSLLDLIYHLIERSYDGFEQLKQVVEREVVTTHITEIQLDRLVAPEKILAESIPKRSLAVPERTGESDVLIEVDNLRLDEVRTIQYSPSGSHLAIVTQDGIELRDVHSLQLMRKLASSSGTKSIDFDGTGDLLASVSGNEVYLWDINTGERVWRYQDKHNTIYDVALDGEGDFLAVAIRWYAIILYPKRATGGARKFAGIVDRCSYVALAKRRHLLAVAGQGGVRLWNLNAKPKGAEVKKFKLRNLIVGVTISNDDNQLVILVSNGQMSRYSIVIESLLTYEQVQRIEIPFVQVSDLALANGRFVSVGSHKGHLWIWDLDQRKVSTHLTGCGQISSLDFSPDGRRLCTATYDGEVRIYRLDL